MIRLFIALKMPIEVLDNLTKYCKLRIDDFDSYRWEQKEKIHLTLKFIGDIKKEILTELLNELEFLNRVELFNCTINKLGFFFTNDQPRILWAGMKTENRLADLVQELNSRLDKFGVTQEKRKFHPHLTLMRIKKNPGEQFINSVINSEIPEINFIADKIALVESTLTKDGSIYKDQKVYELK